MRQALACGLAMLALAGCASTTRQADLPGPEISAATPEGWKPVQPAQLDPPPVMNPATPGPSANAAYDWCMRSALQKTPSPAWTVRGGAFVDSFMQGCMVQLGADPAYTAVLLMPR